MKKSVFILAFLLIFFTTSGADAKTDVRFSASDLYALCTSSYDTDYGYCNGYVTAIANLMLENEVAGYHACNHTIVAAEQFVDHFRTYSEHFPEDMSMDADTVIAASLARAFPCH